jgi:hypothetical protein
MQTAGNVKERENTAGNVASSSGCSSSLLPFFIFFIFHVVIIACYLLFLSLHHSRRICSMMGLSDEVRTNAR